MGLLENIRLAIMGLLSNKMRALLTMLGIIIGIGSVITIVTVGDSMTSSVTSMMNDIGANTIQIGIVDKPDENGNYTGRVAGEKISSENLISEEMVTRYQETFKDQLHALAMTDYTGNGQAKNGRNHANCSVQGVNADGIKVVNIDIIAGHFINQREVGASRNVAVISDKFIEKLFPGITPQEALGKEIKIQLGTQIYTFAVAGVYKYEMSAMMQAMSGDVTTNVYIPYPVSLRITGNPEGYEYMQIKANPNTDMETFRQQSEDFFNRFYRNNVRYEITAYSMDSMIGQMTSMMLSLIHI